MVDPKDIYSLAADHAIDLSDQSWVNETDYAIGVDGQINGFPTCLEARGARPSIRMITRHLILLKSFLRN